MAGKTSTVKSVIDYVLSDNSVIKVYILKTTNKTTRITMKDDGVVYLKLQKNVSENLALSFLQKNNDWIIKARKRLSKKVQLGRTEDQLVKNGSTVQLLNEKYNVVVIESDKNAVYVRENYIVIYSKKASNEIFINNQYEEFRYLKATELYTKLVIKYMEICNISNRAMPKLQIKNVKGYWGQCNSSKNILTFNSKLITRDMDCIEYLVLHEVAHFLVQNHQREFYKILDKYMPDHRERRKRLHSK
ncbi:MAG: YgjP-like metallopeptidase domain-containing protein [Bacillota bacterium]